VRWTAWSVSAGLATAPATAVTVSERRARSGSSVPCGSCRIVAAYGCPHRGLLPFEEDDEEVFYGPERLTTELAVRLARQMTLGGVVGVTGASEAGKSSLLRAGLLPTLARGVQLKGSEHWSCRVIMPTKDPLTELATALAVLGSSDTAAARPIGAVLPLRAALPGGGGPPVSGGGRVVVGSLVKPSGLALTMPAIWPRWTGCTGRCRSAASWACTTHASGR
jgi:hypothetical protein